MAGYSTISSVSFSDFVDTTERVHAAGDSLIEDLDRVRSLYKVEVIPPNTGSQRIYDEYDGETYARYKAEGADVSKTNVIKGWNKTMTMRRFGAEIDITWEMRHVGKDQEIINRLTNLAKFCPQRMALDLTHRLNEADVKSSLINGESPEMDNPQQAGLGRAAATTECEDLERGSDSLNSSYNLIKKLESAIRRESTTLAFC